MTLETQSTPAADARRARRAIGAMFFTAFGGAWLALWAYSEFTPAWPWLAGVAAATGALFAWAWRTHAAHAGALRAQVESPDDKRRSMWFNVINAGQWVLIFVVANVLNHIGRSELILPMIIFVVGAHFLPLAWLFVTRAHAVTGLALMGWSVAYSLWPGLGPASAIGALGAGLVLWLAAGWALRPGAAAGNVT